MNESMPAFPIAMWLTVATFVVPLASVLIRARYASNRRASLAIPGVSLALLSVALLFSVIGQAQSGFGRFSSIFVTDVLLFGFAAVNAVAGVLAHKRREARTAVERGRGTGRMRDLNPAAAERKESAFRGRSSSTCQLTQRDLGKAEDWSSDINTGLLSAMLPANAYVGSMSIIYTVAANSVDVTATCKVSFRPWYGWFVLSFPAAQERDATAEARGEVWCEAGENGCEIRGFGNSDSGTDVECSAAAAVNPISHSRNEAQLSAVAGVAFSGQQAIEVISVQLNASTGSTTSTGITVPGPGASSGTASSGSTVNLGAQVGFAIRMPTIADKRKGPRTRDVFFVCNGESTVPIGPNFDKESSGVQEDGSKTAARRDCVLDSSVTDVRGSPINDEQTFRLTFDLVGSRAAVGVEGHGYLSGRFSGGLLQPIGSANLLSAQRVIGQCGGVLHFSFAYTITGKDKDGSNLFAQGDQNLVVLCNGGFETQEFSVDLNSRNRITFKLQMFTRCE
jgi:hypothetical protein